MINNSNTIESASGGSDPSLALRVTALESNIIQYEYFESVNSASGTITKPTGSTIILDKWENGIDALVSTIVGGQPSGTLPVTAGGTPITVTSFNTSGNYVLSGTPSAFPVAIIYVIQISTLNSPNVNKTYVLDQDDTQKANLNSPSFTGTPTAPTAASTDSSTRIATTAFVNSAITNSVPNVDDTMAQIYANQNFI